MKKKIILKKQQKTNPHSIYQIARLFLCLQTLSISVLWLSKLLLLLYEAIDNVSSIYRSQLYIYSIIS